MAGFGAEEGDGEALVEWDDEEGVEDREDGARARRELECAEFKVGGAGLDDEEGGELGKGDGEGDGGGPDGEDSDEGFQLFHLGYAADSPPVATVDVLIGYHGGFVQESDPGKPRNFT